MASPIPLPEREELDRLRFRALAVLGLQLAIPRAAVEMVSVREALGVTYERAMAVADRTRVRKDAAAAREPKP